jgi:hypothetical protein
MDKLSRRLAGAVVTILDGPLTGTTARSDAAGRFEVKANASGNVTLRASHDGFSGSSVSIPFAGATSNCRLKSARGLNDDCYQVPADQILEHHVCFFDRATLVFTKR